MQVRLAEVKALLVAISDLSLLFQLMLFQVSAEDILHNLVFLAWLFQ